MRKLKTLRAGKHGVGLANAGILKQVYITYENTRFAVFSVAFSVLIFYSQHLLTYSTMSVTPVTLLALVSFASEESLIICPNPSVKAAPDNDVIISCYVDPPVDLSAETLDFKRDDLNKTVVHAFRHNRSDPEQQAHQYRGRTSLNHEDLGRGILTLKITSVQPSDSGPYTIFVPGLMASHVIHLEVVERDQKNRTMRNDSSTTGPPEEEVTEPDDHDAAKIKEIRTIVIATVGGVGVAAAAAAVIFFLMKSGKFRTCMKKLRGMKGKEGETMKDNNEMKNLMPPPREGDEDRRRAAEDDLRETVVNDPSSSGHEKHPGFTSAEPKP